MSSVFFPGSFNPFTVGHASIVERGLMLFGRVVIGVGINAEKAVAPEEIAERVEAIRRVYADEPRVEVVSFAGIAADAAREAGADAMLKGVRSVADFEYERQMADVNRDISGIETILLFALPELAGISSSVVRDLASHGYDVSRFLPSK